MRILCLAPPGLSRPIGSWARRPSMPRSLLPAPLQHVGSFQSTAFFHHDQAYTTATHRAAADDNNTETTEALHDRGREPDPGTLTLLEQKRIRPYFYFIDIHGQLFLQDTRPKNLTSCFKDLRFLDFFYTRLRANTTPYFPEYAWQSPCGKEINFVEAADTPVVFHSFHNDCLVWGGTQTVPFQPDRICVSQSTGRIYHPLSSESPLAKSADSHPDRAGQGSKTKTREDRHAFGHRLGLIKSSLVLSEFAAQLDHESFVWQDQRHLLTLVD